MKRRNLLTTIMAAVMAVVMINTAAGCGETSGQTTAPEASSQSASKSESGTAQKSEAKSRTNNVPSSAAAKAASTDKNSSENIQKTTSFKLYITSKDGVNVRQKPSTSADSLGLGDYGSSYTCEGSVMGEDGSSWYQISYLGQTGYVATAYASKNDPFGSSSEKKDTSAGSAASNSGNTAGTADEDDPDGEAYLNLRTIYLTSEDGTVVAIKEQTNGDYAYRDDSGVGYVAIDEDTQWKDQYGNTYSVLNDETHRFGIVMEQHTITSSDGTTVTVTEKADGEYHYRDDNGTGYTDNGDGTWTDENGNSYTE